METAYLSEPLWTRFLDVRSLSAAIETAYNSNV